MDGTALVTAFVQDLAIRHAPAGLVRPRGPDSSRGPTDDPLRKHLAGHGPDFPAMRDAGRTRQGRGNGDLPDRVLIDEAGRLRRHDPPANLAESAIEKPLAE